MRMKGWVGFLASGCVKRPVRLHQSTNPTHPMKLPHLLALAALALGAGCNSLENPFAGIRILHTGRDARTFNPQTGTYD